MVSLAGVPLVDASVQEMVDACPVRFGASSPEARVPSASGSWPWISQSSRRSHVAHLLSIEAHPNVRVLRQKLDCHDEVEGIVGEIVEMGGIHREFPFRCLNSGCGSCAETVSGASPRYVSVGVGVRPNTAAEGKGCERHVSGCVPGVRGGARGGAVRRRRTPTFARSGV